MKRILWLTLAICSLLLSSCQKDYDTVTLMAEMENYSSGPKVFLDNQNFACWEVGDVVNINGESREIILGGIISDNTKGATLELIKTNNLGYLAAYPGDFATCTNTATSKSVLFNFQGQNNFVIRDMDFKKNISNMMVGYAATGNDKLVFRNVGSIIRLDITNPSTNPGVTVEKVSLQVNNGSLWYDQINVANVNATFSITYSGNSYRRIEQVINKNIPSGDTLSFYVNVLPISSVKFTVNITGKASNGTNVVTTSIFNKTTKNALSLRSNQLGVMPITLDAVSSDSEGGSEGGGSSSLFPSGSGTESDPYIILDVEGLRKLIDPNLYPQLKDKHFKQGGNIKWTEPWPGIGNANAPFTGSYNGNKQNIYIESGQGSSPSIFNNVGTAGKITNINRTGYIDCQSGQNQVGSMVGIVQGAGVEISGCKNIAQINCNVALSGSEAYTIGGICGYVKENSDGFKLNDCVNEAGMVIGQAKDAEIYVGSMCGKIDASNVEVFKCTNTSTVEFGMYNNNGTKGGKVGGLIGSLKSNFTMDRCHNKGRIQFNNIGDDALFVVGGLIGESLGNTTSINIKNSGNSGVIEAHSNAGGLLGYSKAMTIINCFSNGGYTQGSASGFVDEINAAQNQFVMINCFAQLDYSPIFPNIMYGICRVSTANACSLEKVYLGKDVANHIGQSKITDVAKVKAETNFGTAKTELSAYHNIDTTCLTWYIPWSGAGPQVDLR